MCREPHRHRRSEKQSQASLDVEAPSVLTSVVDLPNELAEKHFYILDTFPPCSFSELDFLFQIGRADRHTHRYPVSGVSYLMEKVRMQQSIPYTCSQFGIIRAMENNIIPWEDQYRFIENTKFRVCDLTNETDGLLQDLAQWACCRGFTDAEVELTKIIQLLHTLRDDQAINDTQHPDD